MSTGTVTDAVTQDDLQQLFEQGFLLKRGLAGRERADRARRAINARIGQDGIPPDQLPIFRSQSYCPELRNDDVIRELAENEAVLSVIDALVGTGTINPIERGQIALRFPQPISDDNDAAARERWNTRPGYHIDGLPSRDNGVPPGEVHNFAMLVGVLLNDQPTSMRGNFTVWPGSHLEMAEHFLNNGFGDLADKGTPRVPTAEPLQITGEAGDVVFAHHLLAHGIAPNLSPEIRYNCFFRIWPKARGRFNGDALTDPWVEWKVRPGS